MDACHRIRPLLSRYSEGEVGPHDAMEVARHLPDCTACRIVLARERRLAEMLAREFDDLPVGEEFAEQVMATLPQGPPPHREPRRHSHGLALAGRSGAGP